ncbi:hypothetical protein LguiA_003324 [Lonicera macranthoides]
MAEPLISQHNTDETKEELMDPDMEAAAKQLMQLSGDEDKADTTAKEDDGQSHQREMTTTCSSRSSSSSKKIITSNLFVRAPYKKRKYRSIHHLYLATTPFHGKKVIRS